jgi:hypothetical protein
MALDAGHEQWMASSRLMDLEDARLRFKVQALVQLRALDRSRALAIYGYIKTLPFAMPLRYGVKTSRQVLHDGTGGWYAKSTLFVAMLRSAGLAARVRMLALSGDILRGFLNSSQPFLLPVVEVWLEDRWVRTDTHIHDPCTMALARQELRQRGWMRGFGVHSQGETLWDGRSDAFAALALDQHHSGMPLQDFGAYNDISEFLSEMRQREPQRWALWLSRYRLNRLRLRSGLAALVKSHKRAGPGLRSQEVWPSGGPD